jgi:hypothetical protein
VLRASRTFVGDLPHVTEQLSRSIVDLSDLISEQLIATRRQIAESHALRAETIELRKDVRLMRESFDQFRDKVPGL